MNIKLRPAIGDETLAEVNSYLWGARGGETSARVYQSDHSTLEIPTWFAFCEAPRSVAMQMETHKHVQGYYLWMTSARPDRDAKAAAEYSRDQNVKFVMKFTARAIINISHVRMCEKAEEPTREFMTLVKNALVELGDHASVCTARCMVPQCAHDNGLCHQPRPCGNPRRWPL